MIDEKWSVQTPPQIDDHQFLRWRELLEQRIGMQLPDQRRGFLQTNLSMRMREIGCPDYKSYYQLVIDGTSGMIEWEILVDRLTVQETRFFRDMSGFTLAHDYLKSKRKKGDTLNIWSVGCATGEEPYGLSILARFLGFHPLPTRGQHNHGVHPYRLQSSFNSTLTT